MRVFHIVCSLALAGGLTCSSNRPTLKRTPAIHCRAPAPLREAETRNVGIRAKTSPRPDDHGKDDFHFRQSSIPTLALCCAIAAVCTLDRVLISIAIIPMSEEMGFTDSIKGLISSAFSLGYGLALIPTGLLAALTSSKAVLGGGLLIWSVAQALTPIAASSSLQPLLAARVTMGVGEAAAIPCIHNIAAELVPSRRRSQFWGLLTASLSLGTISAYSFSPKLIEAFGWQSTFYLYGGVGAVLALLFLSAQSIGKETSLEPSTDAPTQREPSAWERLEEIDWRQFYSSRAVWALAAGHTAANIYNYFALAWLPTYFSYQFNLDTAAASSASLLPFVAAAAGGLSAGYICDTLVEKTGISLTRARKIMQTIGFVGPASTLIALAVLGSGTAGLSLDQQLAEMLFVIGIGSQAFSAAGWGCGSQDIATRYASFIYGATSVVAVIAGAMGQYFTGWLLEQTNGDFTLMFSLTSAVELFGLCAFWAWWDSGRVFE